MRDQHQHLKYPNLAIFFSVLLVTFLWWQSGDLQNLIGNIGSFGYLGALMAGVFYVSTFTVIPAAVILTILSEQLGVFPVVLLGGIGAMIGDYLIFKFVRDGLSDELKRIFYKVGGSSLLRFHYIAHTKYFAWLSPVIGALIIASPFPDELGVGIFGIYKLDSKKFALLAFLFHAIGIFILVSFGSQLI